MDDLITSRQAAQFKYERKKRLRRKLALAGGAVTVAAAVVFGIVAKREADAAHEMLAKASLAQLRRETAERYRAEQKSNAAAGVGFAVTHWVWEDNGIINTYCRPTRITVRNDTDYDARQLQLELNAGGTTVRVHATGYIEAGKTRTYRKHEIHATRIARTCRDATMGVKRAKLAGAS